MSVINFSAKKEKAETPKSAKKLKKQMMELEDSEPVNTSPIKKKYVVWISSLVIFNCVT
jgi:hypothetical protein